MSILPPVQGRKTAEALISGLKAGKLSHAYIFEGSEGLGKRETAYYFAEALLCENTENAPCGVCVSCVQAKGGNNPDLKRYSLKELVERDKKSIGVDEVRDVIADTYTKPFKSAYKVYIIEDGDALTTAAQNAMLKILEEPPEYIVFIICVTSLGRILGTVQSRSRIVRFSPSSSDEVKLYVKNKYPHMADKADFAADYSGGILKKADELFENDKILSLRSRICTMLEVLLTSTDEVKVLDEATALEGLRDELGSGSKKATGDEFMVVLDLMLSLAVDILKIKSGISDGVINRDMSEDLCRIASKITYEKAADCAEKIVCAQEMLSRHVGFKSMALALCIGIWNSD